MPKEKGTKDEGKGKVQRVAVYQSNPVMLRDDDQRPVVKEPREHVLFGHFEFAEGVDRSVVRDCLARGDFLFKPATDS